MVELCSLDVVVKWMPLLVEEGVVLVTHWVTVLVASSLDVAVTFFRCVDV